jgi:hypothetical protein
MTSDYDNGSIVSLKLMKGRLGVYDNKEPEDINTSLDGVLS